MAASVGTSAWPPGKGEMAGRIREFDWAETPLGPIEDWPQTLRTTLDLMLPAGAQIALFWGSQYLAFYNDLYAPTIGDKHPKALGRPAVENLTELWDDLEPLLHSVHTTGETVLAKEQPFYIKRHGYAEQVFFDISYSAVRDEAGAVSGVLCIVSETTERALAERALRESEERYRTLFDTMAEGYSIIEVVRNADGQPADLFYPEFNHAFERLSGLTREQLLARRLGEVLPQADVERWLGIFARVVETGVQTTFEQHLEGLDRWYEGSVYPRGEDRVSLFYRDVTDRKRAEDALRDSEERLRAIYDGTYQYIGLLSPDGTLLEANRASLEFAGDAFGSKREHVVGRLFWETVWFVHTPGAPEKLREAIARAAAGEFIRYEAPLMRPSGEEVIFDFSLHPVRNKQGDVFLIVPEGRIITDRKRAERTLWESEARLRAALQAGRMAYWIWNVADGQVVASDTMEELFGLMPEENWQSSQQGFALVHPDDRERHRELVERSGKEDEGWHSIFRIIRRRDGQIAWLEERAEPSRDPITGKQRITGLVWDITEQRDAAERQKILLAELQHRTRNLLAVVRSITNRTLARSSSLEEFRASFRDRIEALARVSGLLSRLSEGERIAFSELIRTELCGHGITEGIEHEGQVSLNGPENVKLRSSTVQTLALGLHELTTNALKYGALSRPEGRLSICWSVERRAQGEQWLKVEWRETGVPVQPGPDGNPESKGYGRELIERALPYQLNAETTYAITPEGVRCAITLPISTK
jgi:PAS domain S-box-containing protein